MKFAIITHTIHKSNNESFYAYEPYVREMNLWLKNTDSVRIAAPMSNNAVTKIESGYVGKDLGLVKIPNIDLLSIKNTITTILKLPILFHKIFKVMKWADHIHLRCPGNIGLLGCLVQILFPKKPKTVKYAGNWDPNANEQPKSYKFQKWLVSNTFLTKNCKVLVYGDWPNQSKNIKPFFTATYKNNEIQVIPKKDFSGTIKFIFVGSFSVGKQPMLSVKTVEKLFHLGFKVELSMFGDGELFKEVQEYVIRKGLSEIVQLEGNQPKDKVKQAFQESHFLIFISKSEGWPKVVAEAMFWSCLAISTKVSCIPTMLDYGKRGAIVEDKIENIVAVVQHYLNNFDVYSNEVEKAKNWSQNYTLDKFEKEISKLL